MTEIRTFASFVFLLILSLQVASQDGTTVAPIVQPPPRLLYKITGGYEASRDQFKFMASIQKLGKHICGATILTPRTILTAAHCFDKNIMSKLHQLWVTVGTNDLSVRNGVRHLIFRVKQHPDYNEVTNANDVAVVQLHVKMLSSHPYIKPIKLVNEPTTENTVVTAIGWGASVDYGQQSSKLMSVTLQTVNIEICKISFPKDIVNEMNVCVQSNQAKGVCDGDSGGPLIAGDYQVGVTSMVIQCASRLPLVFTGVFQHRDFIVQTANGFENKPF